MALKDKRQLMVSLCFIFCFLCLLPLTDSIKELFISRMPLELESNKFLHRKLNFPLPDCNLCQVIPYCLWGPLLAICSFFCNATNTNFLSFFTFHSAEHPFTHIFAFKMFMFCIRWWRRWHWNDWQYATDSWILWPIHNSRKSHSNKNSMCFSFSLKSMIFFSNWIRAIMLNLIIVSNYWL